MGVSAFPQIVYTNDSRISYFQEVDISDGSWTLKDDLSFISGSGKDANGNWIQTAAVASTTTDYNVSSGGSGTTKVPRWFKEAYYDNGDRVKADDNFQLIIVTDMKGGSAGLLRYFDWYFGIADDPTSNTVSSLNLQGAGIGWNFDNSNGAVFSSFVSEGVLGNGTPLDGTDTISYSVIQVIGGQVNICNVSTDGTNTYKSWGTLTGSSTPYSGDLFLALACGARGVSRSFANGDETHFKVRYKFSKLDVQTSDM